MASIDYRKFLAVTLYQMSMALADMWQISLSLKHTKGKVIYIVSNSFLFDAPFHNCCGLTDVATPSFDPGEGYHWGSSILLKMFP